jgi:hypothetical protein
MNASFFDFIGTAANVFDFVGGLAAVWVFFKIRALDRLNEPVSVFLSLTSGEKKIELPLEMRRRDLSRAEILGRLGMVPMKTTGARFALRYLSTPDFIRSINEVIDRKSKELVIPCSEQEFDQFDIR